MKMSPCCSKYALNLRFRDTDSSNSVRSSVELCPLVRRRTRWIECLSQITNRMHRCRALKDFVLKHDVFPEKLRRFRRVWFFSLETTISFYVSSRGIRCCAYMEKNSKTSIDRATVEWWNFYYVSHLKENFRCEDTDSSNEVLSFGESNSRRDSRTRWIWYRFQIENRIHCCRTMEDLALEDPIFQEKVHQFERDRSSLFWHPSLSISHPDDWA